MALIYLIRHGENIDGKVGGTGPTVDLGLSDLGRMQVERLCQRLATSSSIKPCILLSSPECRAVETANELGKTLGLEVTLNSHLAEWRSDDGTIEPDAFAAQCETQAEFFARVGAVLHQVCMQYEGASIAMVTHGGFIQASFRRVQL